MSFLDDAGVTKLVSYLKTKVQTLISSKQDLLVDGRNIKTINQYSILGSGNLTITGTISMRANTITVAVADWANNTCTKSVNGVTPNNVVLVTYAPASHDDYIAADIYCSSQGAGRLTLSCAETPTAAIEINVLIIDGVT